MQNIDMYEFMKIYSSDNKVYLYGASITGEGILKLLQGAHIEVEAFIDKDESKYGQLFCNKNVISVKDIPIDSYVIITASGKYHETIVKMLEEEYGISNVYVLLKENRIAKTPSFVKGYDVTHVLDYEKKYNEIRNKYEKIEMYFLWADRIGEIIYRYASMVYELENAYDNVYRVIMPYTVDGANVANGKLLEMIKRQFDVAYGDNEEFWNYLIEKQQSEIIDWEECWKYDKYDKELHPNWKKVCVYDEGTKPVIEFSDEEIKKAKTRMNKIGIDKKFICVFARDAKYLDNRVKGGNRAYSYHDYRDMDINSYKLVVDYLKEKDMQVVRVGNVQGGRLQGSNVIDITGENYNELLDLYVNSKCEYWMGCNSGAEHIPGFFRRKKIYVNQSSLVDSFWTTLYCINGKCAYIPKLLYSDKEERYLSIKEICMLNMSGIPPHLYIENFGVRFVENTPEDILELYMECEQKYCGEWKYTKEEEYLKKRYDNILGEVCNENKDWVDGWGYNIVDCLPPLPMGTSFLKRYGDFLLV